MPGLFDALGARLGLRAAGETPAATTRTATLSFSLLKRSGKAVS
jgi:hypothetical protein